MDNKRQTELEKLELSFREMLPVALKAMMASSSDLSFIKDGEFRYICCSDAFAEMVGLKSAEDIAGKTDYDLFPPELADKYRAGNLKLISDGQTVVDNVERLPYADGSIRFGAGSRYLLYGSTGNVLGIYGVLRDITEDREAYARLKLLTNSIPGGLASYIATGEGIKITYFNDGFCKILGYTREEYEKISQTGITNLTFSEDVPIVISQIKALMSTDEPLDCTIRAHTKSGGYKWLNLRANVSERSGDAVIINAVIYDVTEQKSAMEAARIHDEEMQAAMSHMGKMICEYDPAAATLSIPDISAKRYNVPTILRGFPKSLLDLDIIDKDYAAAFSGFFEAIRRGEKTGAVEYREKWADGNIHWARAEFSSIFDADGKPVKAIIAVEDTTQQYAHFELEKNRPKLGEKNLLVYALFNLTTGETLEYAYRDGNEVPIEDRTALEYGDETLDKLFINEVERAQYRELNNPKRLIKQFEKGVSELSLDYRRRLPNSDAIWVRNLMHMVRRPGGNDILLFDYFYNIEEEKTLEMLNKSLISQSYDYVARVNGRTGRYVIISGAGAQYGLPSQSVDDLNEAVKRASERFIHPDDREMAIKTAKIDNLKAELANKDSVQITFRQIQPDGSLRYKRITMYYLDPEREIIIITREDVSEFVQNEMRKNEQLCAALSAAQQASLAKSQFLSRMSHELRTPMNAIIGLSALSASEVHNPTAMEDAIDKIGMSARYLLSLINDILEMSRIESGRLTLAEMPFDFQDFISQINVIIFAQAKVKGVDYDSVVGSYTEPVYVGDATKLQEVLVNVLGNAVKFTPRGGKVTLKIEQIRFSNRHAHLRFTVADTGIGIDEAFLPYVFEPFSQEASHYTDPSAGTGLGLAIAKNMVEMMNGQISVKSIKTVGSVFTIEVRLGVSDESRRYLEAARAMNLSDIRALVVDDDMTVCKSTQDILKVMGIEAMWATSGKQALELVKSNYKKERNFNAIFIDWSMPGMDGIDTAREIRQVVGENTTIIIMTAFDWRPIEARALEAGVNMFMEKPLFHTSIIRAFEKMFLRKDAPSEAESADEFDFTAKRILLAEDHPLNVEVARRLLEKVGAQVVVANNGLEAIETFATEKDGWFDAILMDIRMPVMDGLTAVKNIRGLRKKGSRDIPIIAMTANAFDEDVELSLSSGMNAHLAKPIEPLLLYSTLKRLIK